jgi:hypothetical protein
MSRDPHSGLQARSLDGGPLDLDATQGDVEIHLRRTLGLDRWHAWFHWKTVTPNFNGPWRWLVLWRAKRHLNKLRRIDRIPETSIWA